VNPRGHITARGQCQRKISLTAVARQVLLVEDCACGMVCTHPTTNSPLLGAPKVTCFEDT
jgi:hypothetical protein